MHDFDGNIVKSHEEMDDEIWESETIFFKSHFHNLFRLE
jgi:hypothetical protein